MVICIYIDGKCLRQLASVSVLVHAHIGHRNFRLRPKMKNPVSVDHVGGL